MARLRRGTGRVGALIERAVGEFFSDGCPQRAAAISYYALFSVFPLAILLVGVFGLVVHDEQARHSVITFLLDHLPLSPDAGRRDLERILDDVTGSVRGFGIVGIAGLLFAASGVMGSIRQALNAAWNVEDPRPPVQGKLIDIALVLATGPVMAASLVLTLGVRLVTSAGQELRGLGTVGSALAGALMQLGQLMPTVIAFLVFLALFRLVPTTDTRLRDIWPGALLAAIGFEVAKSLFAVYLENLADYNVIYASLGTVIAFIVFVFVASNVFLLGAEVAAHWREVRSAPDDGGSDEPFRRRALDMLLRLFVRRD